jgi:excisionase family DNA binding protein
MVQPGNQQTVGDEKLWTVATLSQYLNIPVATLYKWRQQDVGPPAVRLGKHLRYRAEAVTEWLKSREEPYGTHR